MNELATLKEKFVTQAQSEMLEFPQIDIPVKHYFCSGVYGRQMFMKANEAVVGKRHKHPCLNIILQGCVRVINVADDTLVSEHRAPDVFESPANTKRAIVAVEDSCWMTVHASKETDLERLENEFILGD